MKKILLPLVTLWVCHLSSYSQNVGIGTNNPLSKLHVAGCIRSDTLIGVGVRSLFTTPNGRIYDSLVIPSTLNWQINGNSNITPINFLGTTNTSDVIFKTNNIERARILGGNGFVGIGTPAPPVLFSNSAIHPGDQSGLGTQVSMGMDWNANANGYVSSFYNAGNTGNSSGVLIKVADASTNARALTVNSGATAAGTDLVTVLGNGQVGIGTNAPNTNALVEIYSTTQGVLFPKLTTVQRLAIVGPAIGLMVYDVTANILMSYNGTRWQEVGGDPIGSIEAFHKSMLNTPVLPWGWVECDGQVLADPESPYNGQTMPDLNNTGKFLRGSLTSGVSQVEDIGPHTHTGTTSTDGNHNHTGSTGSVNSTNGRVVPWDDNLGTDKMNAANTGQLGNTPPGGGGIPWDGLATVGNFITTIDQLDHTHAISTDGNHNHTFTTSTNAGAETRPVNMSVVWIIRVK